MNILRALFRTPAPATGPVAEKAFAPSLDGAVAPAPPADTFIDLQPPAAISAPQVKPSKVKALASQDLTELGRDMGFKHHDLEICRSMQERIKAEMSRAIDEDIDTLGRLISELDVEFAKLRDSSFEPALRTLQVHRDQLDRERMKLHEQQLLVAGNSGYVEFPLTSFTFGFKLGYNAHLESVLLLTKYQG
ncbi:MAG: hypothetical protein IPM49_00770 [Flavobacteriales bacterium]|nr:hypothetical protein [Flavobacteriales bacterium]